MRPGRDRHVPAGFAGPGLGEVDRADSAQQRAEVQFSGLLWHVEDDAGLGRSAWL